MSVTPIHLLSEEERRERTEQPVCQVQLGEPWDWFLGREVETERPSLGFAGRPLLTPQLKEDFLKDAALGVSVSELCRKFRMTKMQVRGQLNYCRPRIRALQEYYRAQGIDVPERRPA